MILLTDNVIFRNPVNPVTILGIVIFAIVMLVIQNRGKAGKVDQTKAAYLAVKERGIDVVKSYGKEEVGHLLEVADGKDYKKLMDGSYEFELFCLKFCEDKYNRRTLYDECKNDINQKLRETMDCTAKEKWAIDEFFEWFDSEHQFHLREDDEQHMLFRNRRAEEIDKKDEGTEKE